MLKLQFTFVEGTVGETLAIDASVSETHSFTAAVTDFPVEEGAAISDNVRANPVSLRIEAFISDFPLNSGGVNALGIGSLNFNRPSKRLETSSEIVKKLRDIQTQGILVSVDTGLQHYDNMVIESFEVPRDKSLKGGIRVNFSLKQVRVVTTETVDISKVIGAKGKPKLKGGPKSAAPTPEAQKSLLARGWDAIKTLSKQGL